MSRSQQMIDAANDSQEKFTQDELHQKTGRDYSGLSMFELMNEMKRLSEKIQAPKKKDIEKWREKK